MINKRLLIFLVLIIIFSFSNIAHSKDIEIGNDLESSIENNTIYVGGSGSMNYTKIQAAINTASDKDTIFVFKGTYFENIYINKSINLVGENRYNTKINGNNNFSVITINSKNVNMSNFTIVNATIGIYVSSSKNMKNIIIKNNLFSNNSNGVYFDNKTSNNEINNNLFYDNKEGIIFFNSSKNVIINNLFENNTAFGISLWEKSSFNQFSKNIFKKNFKGIYLGRWSNNNDIEESFFFENEQGLCFDHCLKNQVYNNNFSLNIYGIYHFYSDDNKVLNNTFFKNEIGIYISEDVEEYITNNSFIDNKDNIKFETSPPVIKTPGFGFLFFVAILFFICLFKRK